MNFKYKLALIINFLMCFYCTNIFAFEPISSTEYKSTLFAPTLDTKIEREKNLIYCSTFQMAWNEISKLIDETIEIENAPAYVSSLNNSISQKLNLPKDSFVAIAGFKKDNIVKKINNVIKNKFKDKLFFNSDLKNDYDILSYAYFKKNLEFKYRFDNIKKPLIFSFGSSEVKVSSFGINYYDPNLTDQIHHLRAEQVKILYWSNGTYVPKGCIIQLNTKSINDEILISSIPIENTFSSTYKKINDFINGQLDNYCKTQFDKSFINYHSLRSHRIINVNIKACQSLMIPKISFNLIHSFVEIQNKVLKNKKLLKKLNLDKKYYYFISDALQHINFSLNEEGAKLKSSAAMTSILGAAFEPAPLYFNGPFIIVIRNKESQIPYLMIYIGNDELLQKKSK